MAINYGFIHVNDASKKLFRYELRSYSRSSVYYKCFTKKVVIKSQIHQFVLICSRVRDIGKI